MRRRDGPTALAQAVLKETSGASSFKVSVARIRGSQFASEVVFLIILPLFKHLIG